MSSFNYCLVMMMNNVHFGAGNIGRGFIGKVLRENNYDVVFVDVNEALIDAINEMKEYKVELLADQPIVETVTKVRGLHSLTQEEEVILAIQAADLITTSVGVNILPRIAPVLAKALTSKTSSLQIIACENALNASDILKEEIEKLIEIPQQIQFLNTAVDRIVPTQTNDDLLYVKVEPFYEWVIESKPLPIKGVKYVDDLFPYIQRKLFTVNTGHACVAYLGFQMKYRTISQAIQDKKVEAFLRRILNETGTYLIKTYGFDKAEHKAYQDQTIERFKNPHIIDPVTRIARNPKRKLSSQDRLIYPASELVKLGVEPTALVELIVYALRYNEASDDEAMEIQTMLSQGDANAIQVITGLEETNSLHRAILIKYRDTISSR
jgi:mannitol-1-phosphate 5-dehydrogenase